MGNLLLPNSTSWAHYADQEAQPHCIVCNLKAIDSCSCETLPFRLLSRFVSCSHREEAICSVYACSC